MGGCSCRFGWFAVENKHTFLVASAGIGVPERPLKEVCFVASLSVLPLRWTFPPFTLRPFWPCERSWSALWGKIVPFRIIKILWDICAVETVDKIGITVKLCNVIRSSPVASLKIRSAFCLEFAFNYNLSLRSSSAISPPVEYHKTNESLTGQVSNLRLFSKRKMSIPTFVFGTVSDFSVVEHARKVAIPFLTIQKPEEVLSARSAGGVWFIVYILSDRSCVHNDARPLRIQITHLFDSCSCLPLIDLSLSNRDRVRSILSNSRSESMRKRHNKRKKVVLIIKSSFDTPVFI